MAELENATHVFVTGFPGFIANHLVTQILKQRPRCELTLLVHPSMQYKAHQLLEHWGPAAETCRIVIGNIIQLQLGLDRVTLQDLRKKIQVAYHLAALYDLTVPEPEAKLVNLHGTQHVLEVLHSCPQLQRINYISTCYVSGKTPGIITETHFNHPHPFHNFYESTKYAAEVLVHNQMKQMPITIFRPAIVVGDSETGVTEKFDGPYVVLKLLQRLRPLLRWIPNLGNNQAETNTVPVDYVVAVLERLGFDSQATGKTFQICDPNPPTTEDFYSEMVSLIAQRRPYLCPFLRDFILTLLRLKWVTCLTGIPIQTLDYFSHPGRYRCNELTRVLQQTDLRLPPFTQYYPTLIRYMAQTLTPSRQ